uniref:Ig-like domain-containing protein n=1 Tax=Maribellus sediminis TaxID=2696285 RepID=UPI001431E270
MESNYTIFTNAPELTYHSGESQKSSEIISKSNIKKYLLSLLFILSFLMFSLLSTGQVVIEINAGENPGPFTNVSSGKGDGAISYQWQESSDGINFTDIAGATLATYDPGPVDASTWYQRLVYSTLDGVICENISNQIQVIANAVNLPPIAVDDYYSGTNHCETVNLNVLVNDSDPEGGTIKIYEILVPPTLGTADISLDSTTILYTPTDSTTIDSFVYVIRDDATPVGPVKYDTATVILEATETPVNEPPVALDDSWTATSLDEVATISVLDNDTDPEGNALRISLPAPNLTPAGSGTLSVVGNNVVFTPTPGFIGIASFEYQICDTVYDLGNCTLQASQCDVATVTVTYVNTAPIAVDDATSTGKDTPVDVMVLANDSDPDGHVIRITGFGTLSPAGLGSVTLNDNGTPADETDDYFTFTPNGTVGVVTFDYYISDITGYPTEDLADTATVTITILETQLNSDLVLTKQVLNPNPNEGQLVVYRIRLVNNGPDDASNVVVTDNLPAGLTYVGAQTVYGTWSNPTWTIGDLAVGDTAALFIGARVNVGTNGQTITNTASNTQDQTDTNVTPDQPSVDITVRQVDLVTVKSIDTNLMDDNLVAEGETVYFNISVTNNGPSDATGVNLNDPIPAGFDANNVNFSATHGTYDATTGIWDIGPLANGEEAILTLELIPEEGTAGTTLTNTSTAAVSDQPDPTTTGDDLEESVIIENYTDLVVTKQLAGVKNPPEGMETYFNIQIVNNGPALATNVVLTDLIPTGLTPTATTTVTQGTFDPLTGIWTVGTLAATGAVSDYESQATLFLACIPDEGTAGDTLINIISDVSMDQTDTSSIGDDLTDTVVVDNSANLITYKSLVSGNPTPAEGDVVTFEIKVSNRAGIFPGYSATATNVVLIDFLPAGLTATANNGTTSAGTYNPVTGEWLIPTLAFNESETLTLEGTVDVGTGGDTITNITTEASTPDQVDPITGTDDLEETVVVSNEADIVINKTVDKNTALEGDDVVFTIEILNNGPTQVNNLVVNDVLPAGLDFVNGVVSQGTYSYPDWTVGTLDNGASATLTLTANVAVSGIFQNIATHTQDQTDSNITPSDSVALVLAAAFADLVTEKTLASGNLNPAEDDVVTYEISVSNNGPNDASNITLSDTLPAGLTPTANNGTATLGTYDAGTFIWTIPALTSGQSSILTLEGTVDEGTAGQTISNVTTSAVSPDQFDPIDTTDNLEVTVVISDEADLQTVKTLASGNPTPAEGDVVTFEITVTNNGAALASNVSLTDFLPAGLTPTLNNGTTTVGSYNAGSGLWTIDTLRNGESATLTLEGTVDAGQSGATITNTTTAATGDQSDTTSTGDDLTESIIVDNSADIVITKTVDNNTPNVGDTVVFTVQVTNNGPAYVTNLVVVDSLPAELALISATPDVGSWTDPTWTIGDLAVGVTASIDIEAEVLDAALTRATIVNVAGHTQDQLDSNVSPDDPTETISSTSVSDLVTVKGLSSAMTDSIVEEGETVSFVVTVANNGPSDAPNVQLTDVVPAGLTVINADPMGFGTFDEVTGIWGIGTLANGDTAILYLDCTVDAGTGGTTLTNTVTSATSDFPDPTSDGDTLSATVSVENYADLVTVKTLTSGDNTPSEGDLVSYEVTVTNNGPAQASNILITDSLSSGLTGISVSADIGTTQLVGNVYEWSIDVLNNGQVATMTMSGTVSAGTGGDTISNAIVDVGSNQIDTTNTGDSTVIDIIIGNEADLVTVKTLTSGNETPSEGDLVSYEVTVTNNGPARATDILIIDSLTSGLTGVSVSADIGTAQLAGGVYEWSIDSLNNGQIATMTMSGTVDVGTGGDTISNIIVDVGSNQIDTTTTGDSTIIDIVVGNEADIVLSKTVDQVLHVEQDTVIYTVEVTNNGPALVTNLVVTDTLPAGLTYLSASTADGTWTSPNWNIGTLTAGSTATLEIQATVDIGTSGVVTNTASHTQDQIDLNLGGDVPSANIIVPNLSGLVTVKTLISGDTVPQEGDIVRYEILATNHGPSQATNVSLSDQLPAGLTATANNGVVSQGTYNAGTGLWTIGTLDAGAFASLTLEGTVDLGTAGDTIRNITTAAAGDQPDPLTDGDNLEVTVVVDNNADLVTNKTLVSGNMTPVEGETVTYQIEVTNNGSAQATNVSLTDQLPAGLTATANNGQVSHGTYDSGTGLWTIGTLDNAETATLTLEGTIDAGQGGITITNVTSPAITPDQVDTTDTGNNLEVVIDVSNEADLVINKTVDKVIHVEQDTVIYTIEVSNNGPAQVTNLVVSDNLPAGLTFVSATPSVGSWIDPDWTIGTLANGETATLEIRATVDIGTAGIVTNTASHTQDQDDSNVTTDSPTANILVPNLSGLVTVKTLMSGDTIPAEGNVVRYDIIAANHGPAQATNVSLTDQLPAGLTATANNGLVSQGSYDSGTGLWTIGTLDAQTYATLTLEGTVDAGTGGETITNVTTAASGDQPDLSTEGDNLEVSVVIDNTADLITNKILLSGDPTPAEGDVVTYAIEVTNNGTAQATNISLTDQLPVGLTATANNGQVTKGLYNPGTGLWTIDTLDNGETATLTLEGTVDAGTGADTIINITTTATTPDQVDTTDSGDNTEVEVVIDNEADIVITKTVDNPTPDEGSTVVFTVEVTNNGPAQVTNLVVSDTLPAGLTLVSAIPSTGTWSDPDWTVGTLASGETATIDITATVDAGTGGTTITNTASNTQDQTDTDATPDIPSVSITVKNEADLVTNKTLLSGDPTPAEGDVVTYSIEVTNNGTAQATNISLTDQLPVGLTATGNNGQVTKGLYDPGTGLWTIDTLDNGETATLTLEGTVDTGTGADTIINITTTATTPDQVDTTDSGDNTEVEVVIDNEADIVITKTVDNPMPDEGSTVIFTVEVTNNGPAQVTNLVVSDTLPAGLTLVSAAPSTGTWTDPDWTVGTLASGETATIDITATVDAGTGGTTITNTA